MHAYDDERPRRPRCPVPSQNQYRLRTEVEHWDPSSCERAAGGDLMSAPDAITVTDPRWIALARELNRVRRRRPSDEDAVLRLVEFALDRGAPNWRDFATTIRELRIRFPWGSTVQLVRPASVVHEGPGEVAGLKTVPPPLRVLVRWRSGKVRCYAPECLVRTDRPSWPKWPVSGPETARPACE